MTMLHGQPPETPGYPPGAPGACYHTPMERIDIRTSQRDELIDITNQVQQIVSRSGVSAGLVVVYVAHTTAGVTINENADPDVAHDLLQQLAELVPPRQRFYRHAEGNSAAHVKASLMGTSVTVLIDGGRLVLGRWQGIYFCEFDGPRSRKVLLHVS